MLSNPDIAMTPAWYRALDANARRAFWSTYVGFSIDAMNIQLYSFILPVLLIVWGLTAPSAGLLASAALVSSAIGGWIAAGLSDRLGRVRILRITILWLAISTMLCGLARSYDQLLAARLIQGLGFGAEWGVGSVFLAEIASPRTRGRLLGTALSAWAIGWGLAAAVSTLAIALLPLEAGWRVTFHISVPAAATVLLLRMRLSESPTFLASRSAEPWHGIFAVGMRGKTMRGCLLAVGTHGGYWAVATWWPAMLRLERRMSAAEISVHMAALVGGALCGYFVGAWLNDRVGRRATLAIFATAGIATVLAATRLPLSNDTLLVCTLLVGLPAAGLYSTIGPVLTELYPTGLRGSGLGFCYNVGRGIAGFTPLAIGGSVAAFGIARSIGIYVAAAYSVVLLAAALLTETRALDFAVARESG
jgi:MFS family permease